MSHVPHELHEAFPEDAALLRELKLSSTHFQKIAQSYHDTNKAIHRAEANLDPLADAALEDLKKQRLALLDEVAGLLEGVKD